MKKLIIVVLFASLAWAKPANHVKFTFIRSEIVQVDQGDKTNCRAIPIGDETRVTCRTAPSVVHFLYAEATVEGGVYSPTVHYKLIVKPGMFAFPENFVPLAPGTYDAEEKNGNIKVKWGSIKVNFRVVGTY